MFRLITFCFGWFYICFIALTNVYADSTSIEDLLSPDQNLRNNINEKSESLDNKPNEGNVIDEFLGPEDIFPFLPDNHRDSGTGKFNSF